MDGWPQFNWEGDSVRNTTLTLLQSVSSRERISWVNDINNISILAFDSNDYLLFHNNDDLVALFIDNRK